VAAKAFVFYLTASEPDEEPLMNTIIEHDPVNTPILGYVPNENPDVADLSELGYYLNGSNTVTNESFWASIPSPASLRQPTKPAPLAAKAGTVYVAFLVSDGDNAGYLQQSLPKTWQGTDLGAVPAGWTIAPGAVYYDPTMLEYYYRNLPGDGLPAANVQSMTGSRVLAEPSAGTPFPTGTVQVTGTNLVTNPSGASGTADWTTSGGSVSATTYQGQPALQWTSDTTDSETWVHYYPDVTNGDTYTFTADVAGSGQVYMDVYTGTTDEMTLPVQLSSAYQKLTWTVTIPSTAPAGQTGNAPQLQIRDLGAGPVSVDISNASVAASTAPC
jgi:hypothetical protein